MYTLIVYTSPYYPQVACASERIPKRLIKEDLHITMNTSSFATLFIVVCILMAYTEGKLKFDLDN